MAASSGAASSADAFRQGFLAALCFSADMKTSALGASKALDTAGLRCLFERLAEDVKAGADLRKPAVIAGAKELKQCLGADAWTREVATAYGGLLKSFKDREKTLAAAQEEADEKGETLMDLDSLRQAALAASGLPPLTAQSLEGMTKKQGDNQLGHRIYVLINVNPHVAADVAGKITGMLLEGRSHQILLGLLEPPFKKLAEQIEEGLEVLLEHNKIAEDIKNAAIAWERGERVN